jgi:predicted dehydrogenase
MTSYRRANRKGTIVTHRILIVGCGSQGERHLRCFLQTGRVEAAACDHESRLVERACSTYGVVGYNEWQTAFSVHRPDGVVVSTPTPQHIPIATFALRHGAGVLMERPLSITLDDLPALHQALAGSRAVAAVAYVYRFLPGLSQMRDFLRAGTFGRPLQVSVSAGQHLPTLRPANQQAHDAHYETAGATLDLLADLADAVQWLVGPATRLFCEAVGQAPAGSGAEDALCVAARHGDLLASYTLNRFQTPDELTIQVHCEAGSLRFENHRQRWSLFPPGGDAWQHHSAPVNNGDDLFVAQADAFLDCLEKKETPLCTIADAERVLKFNLAALRSARESVPIAID